MQRGLNPQANRNHNRALILRLIREETLSRTQLAERTGLSKPVVTEIVDDLLARGLVVEGDKGESHSGRKPILLEINRESLWVVGVDLGRNRVNLIITDLLGHVVRKRRESVDFDRLEAYAAPVTDLVKQMVREAGLPRGRLAGIGVGVPLPLNRPGKVVVDRTDVPGWATASLSAEMEREFGTAVFVDNDANVAALYEKWSGQGVDLDTFLYLMVGEGVGCGIIIHGTAYTGSRGMAGEAGHLSVQLDGPPCWCGSRGCLEALASVPQILAQARRQGLALGPRGTREAQLAQFLAAARQGEEAAGAVLRQAARYLASGIVTLVNLFNPEAVIVGGELSEAGPLFMDPLREEVRRRCHPLFAPQLKLMSSRYDPDQVAKGAALLALQHFYRFPHRYSAGHRVPV